MITIKGEFKFTPLMLKFADYCGIHEDKLSTLEKAALAVHMWRCICWVLRRELNTSSALYLVVDAEGLESMEWIMCRELDCSSHIDTTVILCKFLMDILSCVTDKDAQQLLYYKTYTFLSEQKDLEDYINFHWARIIATKYYSALVVAG